MITALLIALFFLLKQPAQAQSTTFSKPLQINASVFNSSYNNLHPFYIRGMMLTSINNTVYTQLENIKNSGLPIIDFRLGIGSISFLNSLDVTRLKNIGVSTLAYNPEGGHTPAAEFSQRFDDSDTNPLVQFAKWGEINGFKTLWAPLRNDADTTSDSVITRLYSSGLDGISLQEQQFIEKSCPDIRTAKVKETFARHRQLAGKPIETSVQIMANRCLTADSLSCGFTNDYPYQHCQLFVNSIAGEISSLAIWPSTDDLNLIKTLRTESLLPTLTLASTPQATTLTPPPTPQLTADANGDGLVDGRDYVIWLNNYNQNVTTGAASGDFNNNGLVDGTDYVLWLNSYLETATSDYLNIPLGMPIGSSESLNFINQYAADFDYIPVRLSNADLLDGITHAKKTLTVGGDNTEFDKAVELALSKGVSIIEYNLEGILTMEELLLKQQTFHNLAKSHGLSTLFATNLRHLIKNLDQYQGSFTLYSDWLGLQSQSVQLEPDYETFVEEIIAKIKAANPQIKVAVQVSVNPPDKRDITVEEVINNIEKIKDKADTIRIFYSNQYPGSYQRAVEVFTHYRNSP